VRETCTCDVADPGSHGFSGTLGSTFSTYSHGSEILPGDALCTGNFVFLFIHTCRLCVVEASSQLEN
jgi:hypothetical protein